MVTPVFFTGAVTSKLDNCFLPTANASDCWYPTYPTSEVKLMPRAAAIARFCWQRCSRGRVGRAHAMFMSTIAHCIMKFDRRVMRMCVRTY